MSNHNGPIMYGHKPGSNVPAVELTDGKAPIPVGWHHGAPVPKALQDQIDRARRGRAPKAPKATRGDK